MVLCSQHFACCTPPAARSGETCEHFPCVPHDVSCGLWCWLTFFFLMWEKGTSIIICTVIKLQNHLKFKFYFRSTSTKCYVRNKMIKGKVKNFPFKPIYENSKRTRAGQLSHPILLLKQKCSLYASQAHCQLRVDKKGRTSLGKSLGTSSI